MVTDDDAILREVMDAGPGTAFEPRDVQFTGTALERIELESGSVVIVKHLAPEGDWLMRSTGGIGRAQLLWRSGLLSRLDEVVEHGTIGIVDLGDHEAILMRDLTGSLFAPDVTLNRDDVDVVLERMAAFHDFAASLDLPPLCTIAQRCNFTNPAFHRVDHGPNQIASNGDVEAEIAGAIDYLASRAGNEAGAALISFFDRLPAFAADVSERTLRRTLLHGDAKPENLGYDERRLVAVDWGELTGPGPAEFDVVRFAFSACLLHTELEPAEMFELYDEHGSLPLDRGLLCLAMLATVATNSVGLLARIHASEDPATKQKVKDCLACGLDALGRAFTGSPS